ncbi:MAG: hypothetical protein IJ916_03715 [Paludibacteraceae bacterium]|jgi:hypothetical protein|nr:hypothetical protein [Paludibacteraceae bacterium]MBR2260790.1 hypothetical protein [Paludibacteraceae bacterium]MEE3484386.1 hypothetical protein [Bacteroidales bacterium]
MDGIDYIIQHGTVFHKSSEKQEDKKIKTKAKKTTYIKGAHGSGSAKMKAEYRRKRQNRNKKG